MMSWPRRSCCSIGSRERFGAWLRPTASTAATTPTRRLRLASVAVAVNVVASFFSGTRLRLGEFTFADRLGLDVFFAEHFRDVVERGDAVVKIGDMQEAGFLETDIDERRLHPGQHARDLALINVSRQPNLAIALEIEFSELVIFKQRDSHFECGRVNCDFSFHRSTLYSGKSGTIPDTKVMRRELPRGRRELSKKYPHPVGHRFTLCVDNLCRIIRGMPDLRKQARLANQ